MARVPSRSTKPEILVASHLKAMGIAFTTDNKDIPGNPDFAVREPKLAVFVNGCFWHWHGCKRSRMPGSNKAYWQQKIAGNIRRDRRCRRLLSKTGWHYWTVWECSLNSGIKRLLGKLITLLL